jgi:uncharacterized protein (DUF1684 family)
MAAVSASPLASIPTMSSARRRSGKAPEAASVSTATVAAAVRSALWFSSSTVKRAGTRASIGTRCRMRSQKAWMVSILRPPGVSTERAKSRRARRSCSRPRTHAFELFEF